MDVFSRESKEQVGFVAPVKGGDEKGTGTGEQKVKQHCTSNLHINLHEESKDVLVTCPRSSTVHVQTGLHANTRSDRQKPKH